MTRASSPSRFRRAGQSEERFKGWRRDVKLQGSCQRLGILSGSSYSGGEDELTEADALARRKHE
jgi:hypothetical protein